MTDASSSEGAHGSKAAAVVAATIRNRIIRGDLKEGDALPAERDLIVQFGLSRPSIREALRILESEALLTLQRGARGGAQVHAPSVAAAARYAGAVLQAQATPLLDVYEARRLIEPFAVELLATRSDPRSVVQLRAFLRREEEAIPNPALFLKLAQQFHIELVTVSGQQTLALFAAMLSEIVERHVSLLEPPEERQYRGSRWKALASHERVIDLIEDGRPDDAKTYWESHIDAVIAITLGAEGTQTALDLLPAADIEGR